MSIESSSTGPVAAFRREIKRLRTGLNGLKDFLCTECVPCRRVAEEIDLILAGLRPVAEVSAVESAQEVRELLALVSIEARSNCELAAENEELRDAFKRILEGLPEGVSAQEFAAQVLKGCAPEQLSADS